MRIGCRAICSEHEQWVVCVDFLLKFSMARRSVALCFAIFRSAASCRATYRIMLSCFQRNDKSTVLYRFSNANSCDNSADRFRVMRSVVSISWSAEGFISSKMYFHATT